MRRLLASLAVLATLFAGAQAHAAFKPGDEVSYTAGGGARTGYVLSKAGTRDLYLVSRNGSDSTQYHLPGARLTLRSADAPGLEQRVNQLEAELASLEGAVDQLEALVDALEPDPPPPSPSTVSHVAPTEGAKVSGVTPVRATAPAGTDWIAVYACGGHSAGEDQDPDANGEWSVPWDTRTCPNGPTRVDTRAYDANGTELGYAAVNVDVSNSAPPPPPEPTTCEATIPPSPIAGQGYTERFADCFDTFSTTRWTQGIWYSPSVPANSVSVENGILNLVSRRSQGYPNVTVTTQGGWGGATAAKFRQGYFEARMRWTKGNGAWPAFWLISYTHATNPSWPSPACPQATCLSAELDVFEGQGREPSAYYGTSHRNSCSCYGQPNQQNSNNRTNVGIDLTADFHTYGMQWTATELKWYLDGRLLQTTPVYDSTNQDMFLLLQMWTGGWMGGTDASTPAELKTEVDWVRVWQR